MLNQRHATAQAVARELIPAEKALDDAIVYNARITIATVEGRRSARLPLASGQEGLDLVAQVGVRLMEARSLLTRAHDAFRQTQNEIGLQAFSYGDAQECPPPKSAELVTVPEVANVA